VRLSWREKISLMIQFEISIRKGVSGSARIKHGGCYVMSKGKRSWWASWWLTSSAVHTKY
jgi:hypothetical protein